MRDRLIFAGQLIFTLLVAAFLVVPAILSISAGVTVNYFQGIKSGVTLQWVFQVWELYAGTIFLSFVIAFATLAVTLVLALIPIIPGLEGAKPYLLTTEYQSWQGLLRTPTDWAPIWHSIWVCALYAVPSLLAAYLVFLRRDVAGG